MRALTIRQPWAQLLATGAKTIETRSRPAPTSAFGQRIAIHSTARRPQVGHVGEWRIDWNRRDGAWMRRHTLDPSIRLPLGAVVGSAVLSACVPVETPDSETARAERIVWTSGAGDLKIAHLDRQLERMAAMGMPIGTDDPGLLALGAEPLHIPHPWINDADVSDQLPFGDFAPGRWAWLFTDAAPTTSRCPACWGAGRGGECAVPSDPYYLPPSFTGKCELCNYGEGRCAPIPAKGRLGLWRWEP